MKVYYDNDADINIIKKLNVSIIGYGSQGHAHALNLKDSGVNVTVGLRANSQSAARAEAEGLSVLEISEAVSSADIVMILAPDEYQADLYKDSIKPYLKDNAKLAFAHGFNIHYNQIIPDENVDVFMVAPKSPGHLVRSTYLNGKGVPTLIAIKSDKSGDTKKPDLFKIGCMGKITSFNETDDGRYIVILNGLIRFKIINEIESDKSYRMCEVDHKDFEQDLSEKKEPIKFSDLRLIFDNLRSLFEKQGYLINWKEFEKQDLSQTINTLAMASPFTLEEKQMLLETKNLNYRKEKLEQIINTYLKDNFSNKTIQ